MNEENILREKSETLGIRIETFGEIVFILKAVGICSL